MPGQIQQGGFADTFNGLTREQLPLLSALAGAAVPRRKKVTPVSELPKAASEAAGPEVERIISAVTRLCSSVGVEPMFIELAIWPDAKALRTGESNYFVSYLGANLPNDLRGVLQAYQNAMDYMVTRESAGEGEPIVTHAQLYAPDVAFFSCDLGEPASRLAEARSLQDEAVTVRQLTSSCQFYRVDVPPQLSDRFPVTEQIDAFVSRFMQNLAVAASARRGAAAVYERLAAGGQFLLVPFQRPVNDVDTSTGAPEGIVRSSPGGCLFLFLSGQNVASEAGRELSRRLHWMMGQAQLLEAHMVRDDIARSRDIIGSTIHTAGNIIQSSGMTNILNKLVYADRAKREKRHVELGDLRYHLVRENSGVRDTLAEEQLFRMIMNASVASYRTATLLAFAEMALEGGLLRSKYQNQADVQLDYIVQSSLQSANTFQPRQGAADRGELPTLRLSLSESARSVLFPKGYVSGDIIAGLLAEFFINARRHGAADGGVVDVEVDATLKAHEDGAAVVIAISNRLRPASDTETSQGGSYLARTDLAVRQARLGEIAHESRDNRFVLNLTLGPVVAQQSIGDISGVRISPVSAAGGGGRFGRLGGAGTGAD